METALILGISVLSGIAALVLYALSERSAARIDKASPAEPRSRRWARIALFVIAQSLLVGGVVATQRDNAHHRARLEHLVSPLTSLDLKIELTRLPESIFADYWRDVAGPSGYAARAHAARRQDRSVVDRTFDRLYRQYLLNSWLFIRPANRPSGFRGRLTLKLAPQLAFALTGCDVRRTPTCTPAAELFGTIPESRPVKGLIVNLGDEIETYFSRGVSSQAKVSIGPSSQPLRISVSLESHDLQRLFALPVARAAFEDADPEFPNISYILPADERRPFGDNISPPFLDSPTASLIANTLPSTIRIRTIRNHDRSRVSCFTFELGEIQNGANHALFPYRRTAADYACSQF